MHIGSSAGVTNASAETGTQGTRNSSGDNNEITEENMKLNVNRRKNENKRHEQQDKKSITGNEADELSLKKQDGDGSRSTSRKNSVSLLHFNSML